MQSIKALITKFNRLDSSELFNALKILDSNNQELKNRISQLEKQSLQYHCRIGHLTNQNVPTSTYTPLQFTFTDFPQFGNMHSNTFDQSAITIRRSGVYTVSALAMFEASSGGSERRAAILVNGLRVNEVNAAPNAAILARLSLSLTLYLYQRDRVQLACWQDTGGNLAVFGTAVPYSDRQICFTPFLSVTERREDLDISQYGLLNPEENTR
jgi:hypothetical protein